MTDDPIEQLETATDQLCQALSAAPQAINAPGLIDQALALVAALREYELFDSAGDVLEALIEAGADRLDIWFEQADVKRLLGELDDALTILDAIAEAAPTFAPALFARSDILTRLGRLDAALDGARRALALEPDGNNADFLRSRIAMLEGMAAERDGNDDAAIARYKAALAAMPGYAEPDTRSRLITLRRTFGDPPLSAEGKGPLPGPNGRLAMSDLGKNGRFANQLMQYGYARLLAEAQGLALEVPDWAGRYVFDLEDHPLGSPLPTYSEAVLPFPISPVTPDDQLADIDITGYFGRQLFMSADRHDRLRQIYTPGRLVADHLKDAEAALSERGRTLVAVHIRQGDFITTKGWSAPPIGWFRDWVAGIWPTLDQPLLYVATDAPAIVDNFAEFHPATMADLGTPIPGVEFLRDFHVLSIADKLAVGNSTFGLFASLLNTRASEIRRADFAAERLVSYAPATDNIWSGKAES